MRNRGIIAALILLASCAGAAAQERKASPEVVSAAEAKATELCGWTAPKRPARALLADKKSKPAAGAADEDEPLLNTDQFYLKAGSPAADAVELARRLCADVELSKAKALEEVGDRLEAELGQVKQAEEKQEATRARAAVREKTAKAQQAKSIIFVLLLAGVTGGGGVYVVKHHVRRQQAPALDPDLVAKDNEDLKKRLNKLRAATAARSL